MLAEERLAAGRSDAVSSFRCRGIPNLTDHFEIEHRPLMQPLGLEQLAFRFEQGPVLVELADRLDSHLGARSREVTKCDFG